MPVIENDCPEGNAEGLKLLRESLKKVQITADAPTDCGHVFVVFGASGDLAKKKIYPTLWALFRDGLMPAGTQIFGYARSKMTVAQLRERCAGTVKCREGEEAALENFWASNSYVAGSYDTQRDFELLHKVGNLTLKLPSVLFSHLYLILGGGSGNSGNKNSCAKSPAKIFDELGAHLASPPSVLQEMTAVEKGHANRLFYLALPPSVFKPVTSMLKVSSTISPIDLYGLAVAWAGRAGGCPIYHLIILITLQSNEYNLQKIRPVPGHWTWTLGPDTRVRVFTLITSNKTPCFGIALLLFWYDRLLN